MCFSEQFARELKTPKEYCRNKKAPAHFRHRGSNDKSLGLLFYRSFLYRAISPNLGYLPGAAYFTQLKKQLRVTGARRSASTYLLKSLLISVSSRFLFASVFTTGAFFLRPGVRTTSGRAYFTQLKKQLRVTGARRSASTYLLKSLFISFSSEICFAHLPEHIFMIVMLSTLCNSFVQYFFKIF